MSEWGTLTSHARILEGQLEEKIQAYGRVNVNLNVHEQRDCGTCRPAIGVVVERVARRSVGVCLRAEGHGRVAGRRSREPLPEKVQTQPPPDAAEDGTFALHGCALETRHNPKQPE